MRPGNRIRVFVHDPRGNVCGTRDFVVEEHCHCLGIWKSENHRKANHFTPLCDLYERGPDSEDGYIANYGEYYTNPVQAWMDLE